MRISGYIWLGRLQAYQTSCFPENGTPPASDAVFYGRPLGYLCRWRQAAACHRFMETVCSI
jgi:hypothetical protein